jgi:Ribonuclease G/E
MVSVRVRGIYATALSKLLLDEGFKLVEASEKVRSRLGVELDTTPCDVTVKDTENPDEILVIGFPEEAKRVLEVLVKKLRYVYKWESKVELHSVYVGIVVERHGDFCLVDIGPLKGQLYPCREEAGSRVVVGVKKPPVKPGETLVLTRNFRLVGKYVALIHGEQKISFSEHIIDSEVKARLSSIAASKLMGSGLGVHFRSSSKYAGREEISSEIDRLLEEYKSVLKMSSEVKAPEKIRHGEHLAIIGLTSLAKHVLDEYRRSTCLTIDYHHALKSMGLSDYVDFAEDLLTPILEGRGTNTRIGVHNYLWRSMREGGRVEIIHLKPTGEVLRLQQGSVEKAELVDGELLLVIKRYMKSPGVYDGLGVEKRPGDVDYMVVKTGLPYVVHNYYRDGSWLGSYVNINTPPEIAPQAIKYHDLLVDVAILPNGEVRVLDRGELDKLYSEGVLTSDLYHYALKALEEVLRDPTSYVYNPGKD